MGLYRDLTGVLLVSSLLLPIIPLGKYLAVNLEAHSLAVFVCAICCSVGGMELSLILAASHSDLLLCPTCWGGGVVVCGRCFFYQIPCFRSTECCVLHPRCQCLETTDYFDVVFPNVCSYPIQHFCAHFVTAYTEKQSAFLCKYLFFLLYST